MCRDKIVEKSISLCRAFSSHRICMVVIMTKNAMDIKDKMKMEIIVFLPDFLIIL